MTDTSNASGPPTEPSAKPSSADVSCVDCKPKHPCLQLADKANQLSKEMDDANATLRRLETGPGTAGPTQSWFSNQQKLRETLREHKKRKCPMRPGLAARQNALAAGPAGYQGVGHPDVDLLAVTPYRPKTYYNVLSYAYDDLFTPWGSYTAPTP